MVKVGLLKICAGESERARQRHDEVQEANKTVATWINLTLVTVCTICSSLIYSQLATSRDYASCLNQWQYLNLRFPGRTAQLYFFQIEICIVFLNLSNRLSYEKVRKRILKITRKKLFF